MARVYVDNVGGSNTSPFDTRAKAASTVVGGLAVMAAGDSMFIDDGASQSSGSTLTFTLIGTRAAPCRYYAVQFGTLVEGSEAYSDLAPLTGYLATTAGIAININVSSADGLAYLYGVAWKCGASTTNASLTVHGGTVAGKIVFERCKLELGHTNVGGRILFGADGAAIYTHQQEVELIDCGFKLLSTSQAVAVSGPIAFKMRGNAQAALLSGSSVPSSFIAIGQRPRSVELEDLDLTNLTSGAIVSFFSGGACKVLMRNIRTGAAAVVPVGQITSYGPEVIADRCGSDGANWRFEYHAFGGKHVNTPLVARTGGAAADDGTGIGWRFTTDSNCSDLAPFRGCPIERWIDTTGTQVLTLYGIANMAALPTDLDLWLEVHYSRNSGNLQGEYLSSKTPLLTAAASPSTDTSAWDTGLTAWDISTLYATGDVVKHAGSPGLVFFCTSGGTSHSSAAGGFTGASDGDTFTETGGVAWRVGRRFKLEVTFDNQLAGRVRVYPFVGKASADIVLDPYLGDIA